MVEGVAMFKYLVITAKRHVGKVSLGKDGDTANTRRGGPQGVGNVLQGGGTSDITVWLGYLGPFGGNSEEGIRSTHGFSQIDHGEAILADSRRYMGDIRGGIGAGSGGNTVVNDLYRETKGNRGTVGGVGTDIRSGCRVESLRGGWT